MCIYIYTYVYIYIYLVYIQLHIGASDLRFGVQLGFYQANTLDAAQQAAALSMACAGEITDCEAWRTGTTCRYQLH